MSIGKAKSYDEPSCLSQIEKLIVCVTESSAEGYQGTMLKMQKAPHPIANAKTPTPRAAPERERATGPRNAIAWHCGARKIRLAGQGRAWKMDGSYHVAHGERSSTILESPTAHAALVGASR